MTRNYLFAVLMLSLLLTVGCATGGNGIVPPPPSVDVSITSPADTNPNAIYPTQTLTLTAAVSNSTTTTVTWSLSGPGHPHARYAGDNPGNRDVYTRARQRQVRGRPSQRH